MRKKFDITDEQATKLLADRLAKLLKGTETLALTGNLGSGKTAFTKMLGHALGVKQTITSPTFTVHRRYKYGSNHHLSHFDAYRLKAGDLSNMEFEDLLHHDLVVVEWADLARKSLPIDAIWIGFKLAARSRTATFLIPKSLEEQFKNF
jgi:tRNA threonylcarbamoyladenosine biosynthesis protein TsaE